MIWEHVSGAVGGGGGGGGGQNLLAVLTFKQMGLQSYLKY